MPSSVAAAPLITLSWLVRLRWGAVAGQLVTVLFVRFVLGAPLPVGALVGIIALTAATNVGFTRLLRVKRGPSAALVGAILVLDTLLLTALLALSGGPANPFGTLYLLHVTLAVVLLGGRWGAAIVGLSVACSAALFWRHVPLAQLGPADSPGWTLHLQGSWLALLVAAGVIAYFVARISAELRARERELHAMQAQVVTSERLSSLTTLAAGAAHELGTPLATIAVVAKELERAASRAGEGAFAQDAQLIREQVERCRGILLQMSAKAGESAGELPVPCETVALVAEVRGALLPDQAARLDVVGLDVVPGLVVPRQALVQVLASLVRNGFDASTEAGRVAIVLESDAKEVSLVVKDRGSGMAPGVLARAGDPFFTTKPPGRGMGLGLFLARAFAEGLGGRFAIASVAGSGTTVTISLPEGTVRPVPGPARSAA